MIETKNSKKIPIAPIEKFEEEGGVCAKIGEKQIAVFYFKSREEWYACDNACPHTGEKVLSRGFLGDSKGEPKVVCPMHKKSFSLQSGECLGEENLKVQTYPVSVSDGFVYIEMESNEIE